MTSRPRFLRRLALGTVVTAALAVGLTGCLNTPGDTSKIALVSSQTTDGWTYDFYRNTAYPCSISGYQTFIIGHRVGTHSSDRDPLWVKMRGGGAGWFDSHGVPQPSGSVMKEQTFDTLMQFDTAGLMADVKAAPEHFRILIVSMCSQDVYGGMNTPDPHNPNKTPDGKPRPTTGLISTKAAIQFTLDHYRSPDYFLQGTSAGGAGSFGVALGLQDQGIPPTGFISDSGNLDQTWEHDVVAQGIVTDDCAKTTPDRAAGVAGRVDPSLVGFDDQSDMLISRHVLTVPVLHIWNHGDPNVCGNAPMNCALRDGSHITLTAADCHHENVRRAIEALGPNSKSVNMGVCVAPADKTDTQPCHRHVVTTVAHGVNTDLSKGVPADYQGAILAWVRARMADD